MTVVIHGGCNLESDGEKPASGDIGRQKASEGMADERAEATKVSK